MVPTFRSTTGVVGSAGLLGAAATAVGGALAPLAGGLLALTALVELAGDAGLGGADAAGAQAAIRIAPPRRSRVRCLTTAAERSPERGRRVARALRDALTRR